MDKNWEKLLKISPIEPPEQLRRNILARIELKQRQVARTKLALWGGLSLASFILIIPASLYVISEFSRSGFYQYFSLLFSDGGLALIYWKEFSLSLAESVPVLAVTVILLALLVFLESTLLAIKNIKSARAKKLIY